MQAVGILEASSYCHSCQTSCSNYNYGPCVFWRGPAVPMFNIPNWQEDNNFTLQAATLNTSLALQQYIEQNVVSPGKYLDGKPTIPGIAAQLALEILANLNSSSITVDNNLKILGKSSSIHTHNLGVRAGNCSISATNNGKSILSYNLEEALSDLPLGYTVNAVKVSLYSYNPQSTLKSRLVSTSDILGEFTVAGDQFPLGFDVSIDIGTPDGLVTMEKKLSFDAPQPKSLPFIFDKEDRTSKTNGIGVSQTDFNIMLESAISSLNQRIGSYRYLSLSGCQDVQYFDRDIGSAVGVHSGHICKLYDKIKNIGKEEVEALDCKPGCKEETYKTTIQEYLLKLGKENCEQAAQIKELQDELKEFRQKVENCCNK